MKLCGRAARSPGVAGDAADRLAVDRFGVGRLAHHRDSSGECRAPLGAGQRIESRGVIGILSEQERIDPTVVVGGGEAVAIARPQALLVSCAEVRRGPRVPRGIKRVGRPSARCISVGEAGPSIAGRRLVVSEEGDNRRRILAGAHCPLGPAPHDRLVGPAGVGDQEPRIIGKAVAAALAQLTPAVQRIADVARNRRLLLRSICRRRISVARVRRRAIRSARRRCGGHKAGQQKS
jgi:hypothetical protein